MGEVFSVYYKNLNTRANELDKIWSDLLRATTDVENISRTNNVSSQLVQVMRVLSTTATGMRAQAGSVKKLSDGLRNISSLYQTTENGLVDGAVVQVPEMIEPIISIVQSIGAEVKEEELPWWKAWNPEFIDQWNEFLNNPMNKTLLYSLTAAIPGGGMAVFLADTMFEDNFWGETVRQVVLGDFTDDCTWLGTLLSIGIGYIPYAGPVLDVICDGRDVVASVVDLFNDGATPDEVVMLLFNAAGFIPAVGDLIDTEIGEQLIKKGLKWITDSEVGEQLIKKGDQLLEEITDIVNDTKVEDVLLWGKNIIEDVDHKYIKPATEHIIEQIDKIPGVEGTRKLLEDVWNTHFTKINVDGKEEFESVGEFITENFIKDPFTDKAQEWIAERTGDVWDYMKQEYQELEEKLGWRAWVL